MKRKKRRLTYGKIKGPDFQPQDIRCPCCFGTGEENESFKFGGRGSCLGCNGSGLRTDFAARLLAGTIQLDEHGRPFEPLNTGTLYDLLPDFPAF